MKFSNRASEGSPYTALMVRSFVLVVISALLFTAGCGTNEARLPGTWRSAGKGGALVLEADKTFTLGDGEKSMDGSWSQDGNEVVLQVEKINGQDKDEYMEKTAGKDAAAVSKAIGFTLRFQLSEDKKTLQSPKIKDWTMVKE